MCKNTKNLSLKNRGSKKSHVNTCMRVNLH